MAQALRAKIDGRKKRGREPEALIARAGDRIAAEQRHLRR